MTKTWKDKLWTWTGSAVVAFGAVFLSASVSDKSNLESKVHQIEVDKIGRIEFEEKCKEIKLEAATDKQEILTRLDALQSQNNQIYQILIEKK